jgi:hypothetical protein
LSILVIYPYVCLDLTQKLLYRCSPPINDAGPVSALDVNRDERKLLVGFAKGLVSEEKSDLIEENNYYLKRKYFLEELD